MRGEWIEMIASIACGFSGGGSLPVRGEWIEISGFTETLMRVGQSLPVRGEWIEIVCSGGAVSR